ncbi:MAG: hypothetical protein HY698_22665 [Deltaproteobacteria bacterium]|nr:hypothetical protein [Deltaproteobacteria bacterium]
MIPIGISMGRKLCLAMPLCACLLGHENGWAQRAEQVAEAPPASETVTSPAPQPVSPPTPAPSPLEERGREGRARPSDFMDTRLSFTCTHEDMFRDPKVLPTAPGFHCGRPNALGVLFFDNYDTRFSGFETLSHLALYRHDERGRWDVEGGFIVRVNELSEDTIRLSDGGSYMRAAYWFDETRQNKTRVALVAFPVSSDRMRLGYSYRISWGGSPEFFKPNPDVPGAIGKNPESTPGARLQLDGDGYYAYLGIKSSLLLDPVINEKRSVVAGLAGAGVDVTPMLRVEASGGVFDRGKNESEDVLGEKVWLYGGSIQLALHDGMSVGSSIDYALYRNEPESIARLFRKEQYPGGLSWLVSTEGTVIAQVLKDPENTGQTRAQNGHAGDVNVRVKWDYLRFKADFMVRDLAFILHSIPSLPTYWDFPKEYKKTAEYFASAGVDRHFPSQGLTAGVTLGFDMPATISTPRPSSIPGNQTTSTTQVVRNESSRSVLPEGEEVALVWAVKGSARLDLSDSFAALTDVYVQYDPNTVRYERAGSESAFATFVDNFTQLGFNVTLQARF